VSFTSFVLYTLGILFYAVGALIITGGMYRTATGNADLELFAFGGFLMLLGYYWFKGRGKGKD
jgi:hypothetical protein